MSFPELFMLAVALSMDAFAVSICKGLSMRRVKFKYMLTVALYFAVFQAVMPLIGYLLGYGFKAYVERFDHWIAFALLTFIGMKMIFEALRGSCEPEDAGTGPRVMLPLAVATSIDALAVGISFAFLDTAIVPAVAFIGFTTLYITAAGVKIGSIFGGRFQKPAEIGGGAVLILIGLRILLSHLGVISF